MILPQEDWILLRGDLPGQTRQMEIAAALSTLVPPEETALRIERAVEVRSDTGRLCYLINPNCVVRGEVVRTSLFRDALREDGEWLADPLHPINDCMAGLRNAQAIRSWMIRGESQRLELEANRQRTRYVPGSDGLMDDVDTLSTPYLAKAAALARLGMRLYSVTGTRESPQFNVVRHSSGMWDGDGDEAHAVRYDGAALILGERADELDLEHPFMLAYRARLNYEKLWQRVNAENQPLIVTPDVVRKGAAYDPGGMHSIIDPNASGAVWDKVEKDFFG